MPEVFVDVAGAIDMLVRRNAGVEQVKADLDQRASLQVLMAKSLSARVRTALLLNMAWMLVCVLRMGCRKGAAQRSDIGALSWKYVKRLGVKQEF